MLPDAALFVMGSVEDARSVANIENQFDLITMREDLRLSQERPARRNTPGETRETMILACIYLLTSVLASTCIVFWVRAGARRGIDAASMLVVAATVAALMVTSLTLSIYRTAELTPFLSWPALALAGLMALTGVAGTVLYIEALGRGPAGPVATICGLWMIVPTLAALWFWEEGLNIPKWVGLASGVVALACINAPPRGERSRTAPPGNVASRWGWRLCALAAMLLIGLNSVVAKYKQVHYPDIPDELLLSMYWVLSAVLLGGWHALRRRSVGLPAWQFGALLGLLMLLTNLSLPAMRALRASVVFLASSTLPPVLVVILSMLVLGERYPLRVRLALGLGLSGLLLLVL